jgi:hypothetical protein
MLTNQNYEVYTVFIKRSDGLPLGKSAGQINRRKSMKKLILGALCIVLVGIHGFGGGQKAAPAGAKRLANVVAEYNEWNHRERNVGILI